MSASQMSPEQMSQQNPARSPAAHDSPSAVPHSPGASPATQPSTPKMKASGVNFYYGKFQALHDIDLGFAANRVTALIGPSGCGKSTFLRNLNRINETL